MTTYYSLPATKKAPAKHLIVAVGYHHSIPSLRAPIDCSCGWSGVVDEWRDHQSNNNEKPYSQLRVRGRPKKIQEP